MEYNFLDSSVDTENINLPEAGCINKFLLKNNYAEIIKAADFFSGNGRFFLSMRYIIVTEFVVTNPSRFFK